MSRLIFQNPILYLLLKAQGKDESHETFFLYLAIFIFVMSVCNRAASAVYSTSVKIALFSAMAPWHVPSSHLAKSTVSGHAQL